jgi:hypothetical protein
MLIAEPVLSNARPPGMALALLASSTPAVIVVVPVRIHLPAPHLPMPSVLAPVGSPMVPAKVLLPVLVPSK